jgi:hypothetical protein
MRLISFLEVFIMTDQEAKDIADAVREIIADIAPDSKEKTMYGGQVFELDSLGDRRLFCGIFIRANHVTVEFDRGYELDDKTKLLEGKGKDRRHLKISSKTEIVSKNLKGFIAQAYNLPFRHR